VARTFITGASGFIGAALLTRLHERGDDVRALARTEVAAAALAGRAEVVRADVLDEDALAAGMEGCDVAYHVAGVNTLCPSDPAELIHVNVRGAETVVRAAARAGIGRLVLTSSAAALGEAEGTIGSEDSPHRGWYLSTYERSKHEGELAAFAAARRSGVDLVAVNPSSVQGPGRTGGTGRIVLAYLNGRLRAFVDTRISLVDIRDCVEGHLLAAENGRSGERYVLCGVAMNTREALGLIAEITGIADRVRFLPAPVASAAAALVAAGVRVARRTPPVCREMVRTMLHGHLYDGSRATRELGLTYTPVRETFARTVEWALAQGLVKRSLPAWESARASMGSPIDMERNRKRHGDFAKGIDRKPDTPEEQLEPDFARGERHGPESDVEHKGRFSEGAEELPETPEKKVERRFSEGVERSPDSD
jgi:dihydroflavonol-4-reductase